MDVLQFPFGTEFTTCFSHVNLTFFIPSLVGQIRRLSLLSWFPVFHPGTFSDVYFYEIKNVLKSLMWISQNLKEDGFNYNPYLWIFLWKKNFHKLYSIRPLLQNIDLESQWELLKAVAPAFRLTDENTKVHGVRLKLPTSVVCVHFLLLPFLAQVSCVILFQIMWLQPLTQSCVAVSELEPRSLPPSIILWYSLVHGLLLIPAGQWAIPILFPVFWRKRFLILS